ncbi:amidohydrolase [Sphingobacterium siyangense]|jgi:amidohydrolase|uniref:Amidohydrolase n=2 Tax=Sphingobacterium TaxID=28453 RepID=A0ABX7CKB2_SPHMU|nr:MULTISPECIES: M20 family metallopeptidase [Sphingobacterium]APU96744.1 N-acyl-L-amino acid amidohydrolase [Sphingobacterium sp. B29]QQT51650.1 amidohydrolase [Sphingobacterium multivorum]QRY56701.1 amidohydrolase [Sphingobacterium siyangense]RKF35009.1 N-acyl-L-amino acid amidohydrolase [Sphingobacterium siyangense]UQA77157.1 amidohydrolase [Sphingobacterium siyangense]
MIEPILKELNTKIENIFPKIVAIRRHIHQHPELSFQEYETSAYIQQQLGELGIPFEIVAQTGVVAVLTGQKSASDDIVVLRADIDALPIDEQNDVGYKSKNSGVMHACGHDFHTANLLGAASILNDYKTEFSGKIVLLFQPAEEKIPGGAIQVLESGILESFGGTIKAVLGLHVSPRVSVGKVGLRSGRFMASSDEFYFTIKGRGGHAAEPHRAVDPIMIGAQLLTTLQQVVSRKANPDVPSVLTFGRFIGDGAANVIPEEVKLAGTFRTMDEVWRKEALEMVAEIAATLPVSLGAKVEVEVRHGYPALYNDPALTQKVKTIIAETMGNSVPQDLEIWMAAEDFAYYSYRYPALFMLIGTNNDDSATQYGLHNPQFNLDEKAFETSIAVLVNAAISLLNESNE